MNRDSFRQKPSTRSKNFVVQQQKASLTSSLCASTLGSYGHVDQHSIQQNPFESNSFSANSVASSNKSGGSNGLTRSASGYYHNMKKTSSQLTFTQNPTQSQMGLENYFNARSSLLSNNDLVKDMPSLRSFACTLNENGFKDLEKQIKGKWQIEKAFNKNQILMPQDTRGLVMIYGGAKDEQKRKQKIDEYTNSAEHDGSVENHFKRRSNSMQNKAILSKTHSKQMLRSHLKQKEEKSKKFLATSLFGPLTARPQYDISSYKKDAVNLLANRIHKKLREIFRIVVDFSAFQEEVQAMTKYDSKFDINEAFENFKHKQDQKGCGRNSELRQVPSNKTLSRSENKYGAYSKQNKRLGMMLKDQANFSKKDQKENIFLSMDKLGGCNRGDKNSLKLSIMNSKEGTPVNIFNTFFKQGQMPLASPIPLDQQPNDFYDVETVDDLLFNFNRGSIDYKQPPKMDKMQAINQAKTTFRDKIQNIKSNFGDLLSHRNGLDNQQPLQDITERVNPLLMSQRLQGDNKENIKHNMNKGGAQTSRKQCIKKDKIIHNSSKHGPLKLSMLRNTNNIITVDSLEDQRRQHTNYGKIKELTKLRSNYSSLSREDNQHQPYVNPYEKLWELIQYKEVKSQFLSFMYWKSLVSTSQNESLHISNISHAHQLNTKLFTRESTIFNTQLFIDEDQAIGNRRKDSRGNNNRVHDIVRNIGLAFLMKGEYMMKKAFTNWKCQTKKGCEDVIKSEILKATFLQQLTGRLNKGFQRWKQTITLIKEYQRFNRQQATQKIREAFMLHMLKGKVKAFNEWKTSNNNKKAKSDSNGSDKNKVLLKIVRHSNLKRQRVAFQMLLKHKTRMNQMMVILKDVLSQKRKIILAKYFRQLTHKIQSSIQSKQLKLQGVVSKAQVKTSTEMRIKQYKAFLMWKEVTKPHSILFKRTSTGGGNSNTSANRQNSNSRLSSQKAPQNLRYL